MIQENMKLGGYLVGWAVKKKDGHYIEKFFDKPKHNTITKAGLNALFEFNGPGSSTASYTAENDLHAKNLFVTASGTNNRYGILNYSAIGDGTGETLVDDTTLKHQVGAYTSTKKTGSGWCENRIDKNTNKLFVRVSHTHSISENFTIKEMGLFTRIYPDGEYKLSARVQLDEFIDVESGDTFYTVYELALSFLLPTNVTLPYLGKARALGRVYDANASYGQIFPSIKTDGNGLGIDYYMNNTCPVYPAYCFSKSSFPYPNPANSFFKYCTSNTDGIENISITGPNLVKLSPSSWSVADYLQNSFYRDITMNIPAFNATAYSIVVNGTVYRLGEYDENNNFVPNPWNGSKVLLIKVRQRISTDLLTPAA